MEQDQRWREIVIDLTESLAALQESTAGAARLTSEQFVMLVETEGDDPLTNAERYLKHSVAARTHLDQHIKDDAGARYLLAEVSGADFQAADMLLAAADEPDVAIVTFSKVSAELDVPLLREQLLGSIPGVGGAQTSPNLLVDVATACNEVLGVAGDRLKDVGGSVSAAVTATSVLDSFCQVVDLQFSAPFRSAIANVHGIFKKFKEWALRLIEEAITKIASWLGIDAATIKDKLADVWGSVKTAIGNEVADLLGRADALAAWASHLNATPPPTQQAIDHGVAAVDQSRRDHEEQLRFVGYANQAYKRISSALAAWTPGGPLVVVLIAAALAGWITWVSWDHLRNVKVAAP